MRPEKAKWWLQWREDRWLRLGLSFLTMTFYGVRGTQYLYTDSHGKWLNVIAPHIRHLLYLSLCKRKKEHRPWWANLQKRNGPQNSNCLQMQARNLFSYREDGFGELARIVGTWQWHTLTLKRRWCPYFSGGKRLNAMERSQYAHNAHLGMHNVHGYRRRTEQLLVDSMSSFES